MSLDAKDILTPSELAERLKVPVSWIYEKSRERERGQERGQFADQPLPVLRCGKYLRFSWPDVLEWLRTNGRNSC